MRKQIIILSSIFIILLVIMSVMLLKNTDSSTMNLEMDIEDQGEKNEDDFQDENIYKIENFYSPELNNYKTIRIYLPSDYDASSCSYPVIYMHDGQNLFSTKTASYGKEWEMDETLSSLKQDKKCEGAIVVGIDSDPNTRVDEYNPFRGSVSTGIYAGGKGTLYAKFIVETLKPYIDKNYRTLKDKANTAIVGSSYGGVISLYTGIEYSDIFGMIGSFSFCDNINEEDMESYLKENFTAKKMQDTKIYFYAGTNDFAYDSCKKAFNQGEENGVLNMTFEEDDGIHDETSWSKKVCNCLRFFGLSK